VLLQITAQPDDRLTATAIRHLLRRPMLLARLAGWLIIGMALLFGDPLNLPLLVTGTVVAVLLPAILLSGGTRRAVRESQPTIYQISEGGVASSQVDGQQAYAWNAFTQVLKLPGQLVFASGRTSFLPVPTTSLTQWQIEQVLGLAAGQGVQIRRA
jgi:hypothetical protein